MCGADIGDGATRWGGGVQLRGGGAGVRVPASLCGLRGLRDARGELRVRRRRGKRVTQGGSKGGLEARKEGGRAGAERADLWVCWTPVCRIRRRVTSAHNLIESPWRGTLDADNSLISWYDTYATSYRITQLA
eukprot:3867259-Rhodomonas_salina.1